jgi:hypothetical protein
MINTLVDFSYSKNMLLHRINQALFDEDHRISKQETSEDKSFDLSAEMDTLSQLSDKLFMTYYLGSSGELSQKKG